MLRRIFAFLAWVPLYVFELVKANVALAKVILFVPNSKLRPNFFDLDVSDLSRFETLMLSHLITLTPGTTSAELSDDATTLVVHAIDIDSVEAVRADIQRHLKGPLLRWTRS